MFVGLLCNAFGVALLTKSGLGASPIAAIPFALSLAFSVLTMGNWLIMFNVLLIVIQVILLGKNIGKRNLILQVGHIERFNPVIVELNKILSKNTAVNYGDIKINKLF